MAKKTETMSTTRATTTTKPVKKAAPKAAGASAASSTPKAVSTAPSVIEVDIDAGRITGEKVSPSLVKAVAEARARKAAECAAHESEPKPSEEPSGSTTSATTSTPPAASATEEQPRKEGFMSKFKLSAERVIIGVLVVALVLLILVYNGDTFRQHASDPATYLPTVIEQPAEPATRERSTESESGSRYADSSSPFIEAAPPGHEFVGATRGRDGDSCEERGGQIVPDMSKPLVQTERGLARPNRCTAD